MKKILSMLFVFSLFAVVNSASAATIYVDSAAVGAGTGVSQVDAFTTIEAAVAAAVDGDVVEIYGTFTNIAQIAITKDITLNGNAGATISTSGTHYFLNITGVGATVSNIAFTKTDSATQNMVLVNANDVTVSGNTFSGTYNLGDGQTSRGLEVAGVTGLLISGNTFDHLRQPAYINAATGSVTNNTVTNTKGFVIVSNSTLTITGNTFSSNIGDIAIICPSAVASNVACPDPNNYTDTLTLSSANDNAVIDQQTPIKDNATLTVVFVDDSAAPGGNGTEATPFQTIAAAITKVTAGGKIIVAAGTYTEDVAVNKEVTLQGANVGVNAVTSSRAAESVLMGRFLITASNVKVDGFKITNPAYSGPTIHGIQVFGGGPTITNITIVNNIIKDIANAQTPSPKGAYGIMVQADVDGVLIQSNMISNISSVGWARGIEVTPSCGVTGVPQNVEITGNSVSGITDTDGTDAYNISVDWCSSVPRIANASEVQLTGNIFDSVKVKNLDTVNALGITKNYWGSAAPDFSSITGTVISDPWCLTSDCNTLYVAPVVVPPAAPATSGGGGGSVVDTSNMQYNTTTGQITTTAASTNSSVTNVQTGEVLGANTFNFTRNLSFGSRGDDVTELQKILMAGGYLKLRTGIPTKYFGPLTRVALIKWQNEKGVKLANGYFGEISRGVINK